MSSDADADAAGRDGRAFGPWLIVGALLLLLGVVGAGVLIYRQQVDAARADARADLETVAALKIGRVEAWLFERMGDARMMAMPGNSMIDAAIEPWLAAPGDAALRERIVARYEHIRSIYRYDALLLAAPDGRLLLGAGSVPAALEPAAGAAVARALASAGPVLGELHRAAGADGATLLDVAIAYRNAAGQPVAVLLLRSAADKALFPLIQAWPARSATGETLLVRRDGDDVVFASPLRHAADAPLTRRLRASTDRIAGRAVRGATGNTEAIDYRGVAAVADVRPVPDTPWIMITKVDAAEIFADARRRGLTVTLFTAGVVVALAMALLAVSAVLRRNAWRAKFSAERAERQTLEEYRATLQSIGDGVLSTDAQGRVRRLNYVAETLTGWSEADARGRPVQEVFHIVNEASHADVENPVARVLREGKVVGLANHTLLVARDGTERPIADSGAPVRRDDGTLEGAVLVFRDQSAERGTYNALRTSEARFRRLFEGSADALLLLDMDRQRFIDCNAATVAMLGLSDRNAVLQTHPADLSPPLQPDGRDSAAKAGEMIETARRDGFHRFEWMHSSPARAPFPVDVILTPIELDGQNLAITSWRDLTEAKRVEQERAAAAAEALERNRELERFNRAAVDRELRMVELKREVDALRLRLGEPARYGFAGAPADPAPDSNPRRDP